MLPVKALVMNLLSLCAAFGLLVLVFQDGHLEWLFRFTSQGAIESSQPVLLFAVAFGLSTDYGVFLLGRIKELHDGGLSNEEAVALGLQRTGRIVTFAALLMVIAIGCFVTAQIIFIKQLGFGVAVAVLIDATIVRALLVPALMRLLGRLELVGAASTRQTAPAHERDRLPRAGLQRRRPADEPAGHVELLWAHDVVVLRLLVGLRDRAGGRGARPARVLQRVRAGRDASSQPEALLDACKAVERAFGREQAGEDGLRQARAAARSTSTCCCWATPTYSSERLTLPHREVTSRRFVLVPLLELDPQLEIPGRGRAADALARAHGPGRPAGRAAAWRSGP